jgi:chemotaxis protein CheX
LTSWIWGEVLNLNVEPSPEEVDWGLVGELPMVACVQITGAWEGVVAISCPVALARDYAGIMFKLDSSCVAHEDSRDAMGELANMMGGNIKSLLPEPCHISLPAVVNGSDYTLRVPGSRVINQLSFKCKGQPLTVTVLEKEEAADARKERSDAA